METKLEKFSDIEPLIETKAREIAQKVYSEKATQFGVPKVAYHIHNGIDSPLLKPQIPAAQKQYSVSGNFSSSTTATITAGFEPKQAFIYAYLYQTSAQSWGVSSGQGGVSSPTTGMCTCLVVNAVGNPNIEVGSFLAGNTNCHVVISSWSSTGIVLTSTVPANWFLYYNLILTD